VPVFGLDLGAAQDAQGVAVLEVAIVGVQVELAVFGEDEAIERALGALAGEVLR